MTGLTFLSDEQLGDHWRRARLVCHTLSRRADGYLRTPARGVDAKQSDRGHDHAVDIAMAEIL
jgi:hypothetical protein